MKRRSPRLSHVQIIALGFFLMIAVGTVLLLLPCASRDGRAGFTEALFTATSASCVTGLVLVDTYTQWSIFGQCVILLLIQIGGLGFMTIATGFFLLLRRRVGLRSREVLSESLNSTQVGGIVRLTRFIIRGTLTVELVGAIILAARFCPRFGLLPGMWMGLFHSVSAFCNAGFDLLGQLGKYSSFTAYYNDWVVTLTLSFLIIAGGLGFLVWDDLRRSGLHLRRYSLHSRIVLSVTAMLLAGGTVLMFIFERNATGAGLSLGDQILTAFFGSVTARTAGFNSVDTAALSEPGKLLTIALMFIGGSPGSTAGGVKTTTVAVIFTCAISQARGHRSPELFGRRLDDSALRKSIVVILLNLILAIAASFILSAAQPIPLTDALFESFSAIGTVGMTTGITRDLGGLSRYVIIFLMYCGRVGSLSFATALAAKKAPPAVTSPQGKITVG